MRMLEKGISYEMMHLNITVRRLKLQKLSLISKVQEGVLTHLQVLKGI